jgi:diguanylate cyclase (GGDEF)-like protein
MTEQEERAYQVSIDPATGLYDRRTMWSRLAEEVSRARRYRYSLALMLITFNVPNPREAEGYVVQLAETLKRHTRAADILVRYNENSLAMLLPCTDTEGALQLAHRIQHLIQTASQEVEAAPCSIGVTTTSGEFHGDKIALLEQVEWAMRQAHKEGTDIVVVPAPKSPLNQLR